MKLFKHSLAAMLLALSMGSAKADFITVGSNTENRIMTDTRWTRDNVYILSRVIIVTNGATLTIEPGTIVRAITANLSRFGSEPGSLLIARGAKIVANGTADDPIYFTSIDDTNVPGGINTVPETFTSVGNSFPVSTRATRPASVAANGTFTVAAGGKRPAVGSAITFSSAPAGLTVGAIYYVVDQPAATTFRVTLTVGGTIAITSGLTAGLVSIDTVIPGPHTVAPTALVPLTEAVTDDALSTSVKFINGAAYKVLGTSIPGGLATDTTYYVINSTNPNTAIGALSTFQLAATAGGSALDITSNGTDFALAPDSNTFVVKGNDRDVSLIDNNYTPEGPTGNNGFNKANLWGGVIICGRGYVGQSSAVGVGSTTDFATPDLLPTYTAVVEATVQNNGTGTDFVEGLATASGSNLLNPNEAIYGGLNDSDNSGVIRFCSMRYGGFVVGAAATGNEINGITVCGAGTGTTLEFIEIFQNRDDGFEWFGGKHNTRFLFSIANQDDLFDADEGFRGTHQFWLGAQGSISTSGIEVTRTGFTTGNTFVGQSETASDYRYDRLLEIDGPETADQNRLPRTNLTVMNATLLAGTTQRRGIQPRDEAVLTLVNTVIEGATAVNLQETGAEGEGYMTELRLSNIHSNNPAALTPSWSSSAFANTYDALTTPFPLPASTAANAALLAGRLTTLNLTNVFTDHGTTVSTSQIASNWNESAHLSVNATSDLYTKNGFDPRTTGSGAKTEDGTFVTPVGFVDVDYAGMSLDNNFMAGWSTLEWLQVLPTTNVARPAITITRATNNPVITFASAGAAVKYVIEKSTDGKIWTVLTTTPVTHPTSVSYTDTSTDLSSVFRVQYRAYAL